LLDTSVVSELPKPRANADVVRFADQLDLSDTFLSVVTIGELRRGMFLLDEGRKRTTLSHWIDGLVIQFSGNIVPVDMETCDVWAEISARSQQRGRTIPMADGLIAATALQHDMHVVTRNVKDFEPTGVLIVNPWKTD
jgi:predicted nucleic acid-binding protein